LLSFSGVYILASDVQLLKPTLEPTNATTADELVLRI
jgi:hypothetical protein